MTLIKESRVNDIYTISEKEKERIFYFLQGAVYCWCKNKEDKWFSIRDLMGGENYYWQGTPLLPLFDKHEVKNPKTAIKRAGIDAGWILKKVLNEDDRRFESKNEDMVSKYRWKKDS